MIPSPLRFIPILKPRPWGSESWEIVDRPGDQSVVAEGPLKGKTLRDLVREEGKALLGNAYRGPDARFPLLIKTLEANDWLSVQVHPAEGPDRKTEAWLILEAKPGAELLLGSDGTLDPARLPEGLKRRGVKAGDLIPVPAGTVHALGPGIRLAEVQENSDTTYRLYDWGRGSRPLQVAEAMKVVARAPKVDPPAPFTMAVRKAGKVETRGSFCLVYDLAEGWLLIPACLEKVNLQGDADVLEVRLA